MLGYITVSIVLKGIGYVTITIGYSNRAATVVKVVGLKLSAFFFTDKS